MSQIEDDLKRCRELHSHIESQYFDALTYVITLLEIIEGNSKIENMDQYMKDLRYYIDDHITDLNGCACFDNEDENLPF